MTLKELQKLNYFNDQVFSGKTGLFKHEYMQQVNRIDNRVETSSYESSR